MLINRTFFVKDLLSFESLCSKTTSFEFETFEEFKKIKEKLKSKPLKTLIISISKLEEVLDLMKLLSSEEFRDIFFVIKLRNFSLEILNSFLPLNNYYIQLPLEDVKLFSDFFFKNKEKLNKFISIFSSVRGISEVSVSRDNLDNLIFLASSAFYDLPFFSLLKINWNYSDLDQLKIEDIKKLETHIFWIKNNLIGRKVEWKIDSQVFSFEFNIYNIPGYRKIFISNEDKAFIESPSFKETEFLVFSDINANNIPLTDIDKLRKFYDIEFNEACGIKNLDIINIYENFKAFNSPGLIPYSCKIIDSLLAEDIK